ncbi:bifunctional 2-polyprenyl-6-hydroxyphenol methylase/3-demethylubiquinol 3-O-methyltransferase UbiG [Streptomyces sp. NL15-2K]|uniref:class I SAM-dependent methyltransferase n=1 Tax=Streptomyces sp. NL15-2K TaxID=376149 RepID=UPI000F56494D|nr:MULTISPECIES: class I SAM-dependent methyltransferase [Actinomycetes]WKX13752.1 class I SAM-dependent methyltransferase [Kutzneria buriramensis]GCB44840.1 methyltransferase [Streptomyces sp. NL15-2K]
MAVTGGWAKDLDRLIATAGSAVLADLLAAEIQHRLAAPHGAAGTAVSLTISHGNCQYAYQVMFKEDQAAVTAGPSAEPVATISYDLTDLIRLLYAPHPGYASTSREVDAKTWPWPEPADGATGDQFQEMVRRGEATREELSRLGRERLGLIAKAVHAVIAACEVSACPLSDLAVQYGSDKWGSLHWYTQHYQRHFADVRYDPIRILEIGIGGYGHDSIGGGSLYMWQQFFPRALVYGLDIYPKPAVTGPRIRTIVGDQNDPAFLAELAADAGPFDIIIDDGSHINEHISTSFTHLFPHVRPGGWYVIEDLHTAYWPAFGGNALPGAAGTSVALLKEQLDRLHHEEYLDAGHPDLTNPSHPSEVLMYHNIAFLRKGNNREAGIPAWIKNQASRRAAPGSSH